MVGTNVTGTEIAIGGLEDSRKDVYGGTVEMGLVTLDAGEETICGSRASCLDLGSTCAWASASRRRLVGPGSPLAGAPRRLTRSAPRRPGQECRQVCESATLPLSVGIIRKEGFLSPDDGLRLRGRRRRSGLRLPPGAAATTAAVGVPGAASAES